jgi:hypothetical protein
MEEILVIFACLNSTGCTETSGLYFNTHPEVREIAHRGERLAKKYVGPFVIESVGPFIMVAAGGSGTIRLNKYFSLQGNKNNATLGFRWEF